ncbi:MAG: alpha/beta fold hydrolase [Actinobacteria bacterium ATB1]|nr:alpha/beta fold hydrolase [Actinobacteria bacterium ATB1]
MLLGPNVDRTQASFSLERPAESRAETNGAPAAPPDLRICDPRRFSAYTVDDVKISGLFHPPRPGDPVIVVCHGFTGTHDNEAITQLTRELVDPFGVAIFDFRGHGKSEGRSTLGDAEALDVEAVVTTVRELAPGSPVVGLGFSMGAAALVRAAALYHGLDAVIAVSTPAHWKVPRRPTTVAAALVTRTSFGRSLLRRISVHVHPRWTRPASPSQVASGIDVPVAVVSGAEDRWFPFEDAVDLYDAMRAPRSLLNIPGGGHGEKLCEPQHGELWRNLVHDLLTEGLAREDEHLVEREARGPVAFGAYED